jgi:hypothetical protein
MKAESQNFSRNSIFGQGIFSAKTDDKGKKKSAKIVEKGKNPDFAFQQFSRIPHSLVHPQWDRTNPLWARDDCGGKSNLRGNEMFGWKLFFLFFIFV